jgi:nucleoside-diphosphate-sugar epimerase
MASYDVLVTGSSGHLGTALMLALPSLGFTPFGVDILPSATTTKVGSITDRAFVKGLFEHHSFKHVLHAATLHKPHICSHTNTQFIETNITGTLNLLEEAAAANKRSGTDLQSFIFFSTTSTFGAALSPRPGSPAAWITEDVVPVPKNIYGITKVAAEDMCYLAHKTHDIPVLVLRTSRFFPEADDDEDRREAMHDDNLKVLELAYRRCDIADIVDATVCAMAKAGDIRWAKYIISAPPPFVNNADTLVALDQNLEELLYQVVPQARDIIKSKFTFEQTLERLGKGEDWRSELAIKVGKKGYHAETTGVYTTR